MVKNENTAKTNIIHKAKFIYNTIKNEDTHTNHTNVKPIPFKLSDSDDEFNEAISTQDVNEAKAFEAEFAIQKAIQDSILTNTLSKAVQNMTLSQTKSDACSDCSYQYNREQINQSDEASTNIEPEKSKHTESGQSNEASTCLNDQATLLEYNTLKGVYQIGVHT